MRRTPAPARPCRPWAASLMLLISMGCGPRAFAPQGASLPRSDVKAPGNLPVRSPEQLAEEARARAACAEACAGTGDAQTACVQACFTQHPIEQVEVRPESPVISPE